MLNLLNKLLIGSGLVFKKNSGLAKIWFSAVLNPESSYTYKDVPKLSNLREVVGEALTEIGYDIHNEAAA